MKLFGSGRSPYVRKVMVAAHELGMAGQIERINVVVSVRNLERNAENPNPFGQIPTLIADDGSAIHDSLVICEYLAQRAGAEGLFSAPDGQIRLLTRHATAQSMLDMLLRRLGERNRNPEQENEYAAAYRIKVGWGLDQLECNIDGWMDYDFDVAQITVACVLSYLDFRFAEDDWRLGRPTLSSWYSGIETRSSMQNTAFKG